MILEKFVGIIATSGDPDQNVPSRFYPTWIRGTTVIRRKSYRKEKGSKNVNGMENMSAAYLNDPPCSQAKQSSIFNKLRTFIFLHVSRKNKK